MACGKTTLGRALAKELGFQFIDLDFYITQRFRKSIPEIFAERGEEGFRKIESNMLREAGEFDNTIVSCGGGTPCFFDNMDYMNSRGKTLLLEASIEKITQRLLAARTHRPIMEGKTAEELPAFISGHLETRMPFYSKATHRIDSTELESKENITKTVAIARHILNL